VLSIKKLTKPNTNMKKLLLLLILCFFTAIASAQFTQPSQFNYVCDDNNDGYGSFYLGEISFEILGNLNAQDYVVTHHATQTNAQTGANPLSSPYFNITPNTQTLYARIVTIATSAVQIYPYQLHVNPAPVIGMAQDMIVCSVNGMNQCANLLTFNDAIVMGAAGLNVTYYETQAAAYGGFAQISNPACYMSPVPGIQTIYFRVQDVVTGCFSIGSANLIFQDCSTTCEAPTQIMVSNVTATTATISWVSPPDVTSWAISVIQPGVPLGTIPATTNPYVLTGLSCDTAFAVSVASTCANGMSSLTGPYNFMTMPCVPTAGQPTNLQLCGDTTACFDLTANTSLILNTLNPADYTVTYHLSQADANAGVSPIINPSSFCAPNGQIIHTRVENNATHQYELSAFALIVNTVLVDVITVASMDQCDDNNDSVVTFNLTDVQAQINSGNPIEYYTSLANAQNQVVPIPNPATFTVGVQSPVTAIFVREIVPNGCDIIYTFSARAYAICNLAVTCPNANSLCNALGIPFANTHQSATAEPGNYYGCLNSQPNPTWFYLPVSANGAINLMIEQNSSIAFTSSPLDVDYIVYGPFTNPVTPCSGQLTQANMVSCSYSPNAVEYPSILNAQFGQYYIIMVTNYANQPGFIRITELGTTTGAIGCSGLRLNAFLDSNSNGTQDTGESNFPLGQFTYEVNNNGNIHNITSPLGVYNIYDANVSNSYDFSFAVDPNYTSLYNVSTASYSNVNVVGTGMTVYNFPVTIAQPWADLAVSIVPVSAPRPGFTYQNKIIYTNNGNQIAHSGIVHFIKDALVTITGNTQAGTTPTANGFDFNFTELLPFETRTMTVTMLVPTIPTVQLGGLLTNSTSLTVSPFDFVSSNNTANVSQIILGSYDPNDKMESHGEEILHSTFTAYDYLYYTIRFENTGTASAVNVRVNDVLDAKLDETSIRMVSSSHPYVLDRLDNNLNWRFENVQLPPSVADTNIGKGYITFAVKPKAGYAIGDIIPNAASIYFDFNPAIVTNTFNTEFVQQLGVAEFENADFVFYPNPASANVTVSLKNQGYITKIEVYDISGKMILSQKPNALELSQTVNLSTISKGMYLLEVTTDANVKAVKKLLIE
jgi:uncharacterized repeat protein (TIGR01451 family)